MHDRAGSQWDATGWLDEVRIYGRAISSNEVRTLATPDINAGLVAYYPFNGNGNDESGNGNNGTVNGGMAYTNGVAGQAASLDGVDDYVRVASADALSPTGA